MTLAHACSLCRSKSHRLDCPRCETRQLSLFAPPAPFADDIQTTTVAELAEAARLDREAHAARLARLAALGRQVRVGLVGCAKKKREQPAPARLLYRSPLFVLSLAYAERCCDETYVLSAAHGLVPLDETVPPYDRTLREMSKTERIAWGARMAGALESRFARLMLRVIVLAGLDYAQPLQQAAYGKSWVFVTPLARKPIGARLAWLREQDIPMTQPCASRSRGARP